MRDVRIHPSLLSADFSNLGKDVAVAQECGADGIHCDVMDGRFVPNITFGPMVVKAIRPLSAIPLYCHLMIEHPENFVEEFAEAGADEISVHAEACVHLHRVIQRIRATGVNAGVALNPATPVSAIENVIDEIDVLLIMTVNPGFGGQAFIPAMLRKIAAARRMADEAGVELDIAVDGGIDTNTAPKVVRAGANILISGTAIFGNHSSPTEACSALRLAAQNAFTIEKA